MRKKKDKAQFLFGLKCVILSVALLLAAAHIIVRSVFNIDMAAVDISLRVSEIACILVVLFFEIHPYIQLYNEGIQAIYNEKNIEVDKVVKFNRLIEHNEFLYYFQPIINAKDGSIYAYEILMRSRSDIGLNPHEILKYAEISHMLYSIEHFTFFNALRIYKENREKFGDKKIFINSIPSVTLTDTDLHRLTEQFSNISQNVVIEILESASDNEESIDAFEQLRNILNCQIAIDDYGSGYSNDMKLLNNNPNYIKIDISLISSIDTDLKKQLLVANLIKFAKKYNIKILGEGVETKAELNKLIELGVDLIQGFYTARPSEVIVDQINEDVRDFIIDANIKLSKYDNEKKVYDAADGEVVRLLDLAVEKYAVIQVSGGTVNFEGIKGHTIDMIIRVEDYSICTLIFDNVDIKGAVETTVQIGKECQVEIIINGENYLYKEGILVPEDSSLMLRGSGNLSIKTNRNNGVGIGTGFDDAYGNISIDLGGALNIDASGDKAVGIGGGIRAENSSIRIIRGDISVKVRAIEAVGIGSGTGSTSIYIGKAQVKVHNIGDESVGIGALSGKLDLVSGGDLEVNADGEKTCGIGVHEDGEGKITFTGGQVSSIIHGALAVAIGTITGGVDIMCSADMINVYGEGEKTCAIGNLESESGSLTISHGTVMVDLLSAEPVFLGNRYGDVIITGGNVIVGRETELNPVNSFGDRLVACEIENENIFNRHIVTEKGDYVYRAEKNHAINRLCVFLPEAIQTEAAK